MIKRLLVLLLLAEAAAVLLLAWGASQWWLLAGLPALGVGLAVLLLLRLLITVNNFHLSWRKGSATPAEHVLAPLPWLRMLLGEFAATMLTSSWTMLRPVGWQVPPAGQHGLRHGQPHRQPHRQPHSQPHRQPHSQPQGRQAGAGLPVLLVHGYACNGGYWRQLSARLRQAGISHAALDLEPPGGDIDDFADQLEQAAARLCAATGSVQLIVVGHSMGGLVARAWMRRYGSARVARVITLGTPHHGTALAGFGPGRNAVQMRHQSDWLAALAASEANSQRGLITSIYSHHDNIVAPQDSGFLPGARNIALGAIGHVALGRHASVLQLTLEEIAAANMSARAMDSGAALA
ncbi:alpha/beta fold hydrolase [Oxalobacteraceae bacterium]|nr:alpha/beta fold hydrolase [Oxalobacteraceae bacterium]